jgi:protein-S-isoprenylcysteine O-methyltransferase Ste14
MLSKKTLNFRFGASTLKAMLKLRQNQNHHGLSDETIYAIGVACVVISVLLIVIPYLLYPQFYTPKPNPAMGYQTPNTPTTWAILIIAVILLVGGLFLAITHRTLKHGYKFNNLILH